MAHEQIHPKFQTEGRGIPDAHDDIKSINIVLTRPASVFGVNTQADFQASYNFTHAFLQRASQWTLSASQMSLPSLEVPLQGQWPAHHIRVGLMTDEGHQYFSDCPFFPSRENSPHLVYQNQQTIWTVYQIVDSINQAFHNAWLGWQVGENVADPPPPPELFWDPSAEKFMLVAHAETYGQGVGQVRVIVNQGARKQVFAGFKSLEDGDVEFIGFPYDVAQQVFVERQFRNIVDRHGNLLSPSAIKEVENYDPDASDPEPEHELYYLMQSDTTGISGAMTISGLRITTQLMPVTSEIFPNQPDAFSTHGGPHSQQERHENVITDLFAERSTPASIRGLFLYAPSFRHEHNLNINDEMMIVDIRVMAIDDETGVYPVRISPGAAGRAKLTFIRRGVKRVRVQNETDPVRQATR